MRTNLFLVLSMLLFSCFNKVENKENTPLKKAQLTITPIAPSKLKYI